MPILYGFSPRASDFRGARAKCVGAWFSPLAVATLLFAVSCGGVDPDPPTLPPVSDPSAMDPSTAAVAREVRSNLTAFGSAAELDAFVDAMGARPTPKITNWSGAGGSAGAVPTVASGAPDSQTASAEDSSITNTQTAGVDEGGIVKVHGNHLVILRRGRLFTVDVGDTRLTPIAVVDAYGPWREQGSGTWYDELLVAGNRVVVVGYSYARGGTELGLFDIDGAGNLTYRATYHLRSNDYYSSRNYASRLIGDKLVFYAPFYFNTCSDDRYCGFPAVRKWSGTVTDRDFRVTARPDHVFRPVIATDDLTLHTVTTCDLAASELTCSSTVMIGPSGHVFYVSATAVYVWVTGVSYGQPTPIPAATETAGYVEQTRYALIFRLPLDGGRPGILAGQGSPVDQFSFLEENDHLNVLVRADSRGDWMWNSEYTTGAVALMRVPVGAFSDKARISAADSYRALPPLADYDLRNRFVGSYLLYGGGGSWMSGRSLEPLHLVRYDSDEPAQSLAIGHRAERIEVMGSEAVVIGSAGNDLIFSPISLGATAALGTPYTRANAAQGESRSQAFFYLPETSERGLVGLPIRSAGQSTYNSLTGDSASVLFLRRQALAFTEAGALASGANSGRDDACVASCVDWYGNARPIFLRGRIFALLGYEIVEGSLGSNDVLQEIQRASFEPGSAVKAQ